MRFFAVFLALSHLSFALAFENHQCPATTNFQSLDSRREHGAQSTSFKFRGEVCSAGRNGGRDLINGGDAAKQKTQYKNGAEISETRYIVRFNSYRHAEEWREELVDLLGPEGNDWNWVQRHNRAAAYPTDFGLIQVVKDLLHSVKERLLVGASVKDIHPDRQIAKSMLWEKDPEYKGGPMHGHCHEDGTVTKLPGRFRTRPTFGLDEEDDENDTAAAMRRSLKFMDKSHSVTGLLEADKIWELGFTGQKVRMGVFDTGVRKDHPHIKNVKERTNWTHEPTLDDGLGHGSFVAGVIAGSNEGCRGLAPDVDLYTFRVFTNDQVSFTSWFMDAFNYAIITKMHIVNLSIGGPDFLDEPFVDKVLEITSNGIVMVSAIGNDGPLYGTLNNPADQNDVIGVGGITYSHDVAHFSSRGMSTWELPLGYGRMKPDIMAYAQDVRGSKIQSGCRSLSGTSVASPVAAGAVCLLASTVPEANRWSIINPASMKQALVEGATRLEGVNMYEQGNGHLNLSKSMNILQNYAPRASLVPSVIDLTDCPYMWPFCTQPLYAHAMPVMMNATILNGMGVVGELEGAPQFEPTDEGGELMDIAFEHSDVLWPWSGYLAIYITVKPEGETFSGTGEGNIVFTVISPPALGEQSQRKSTVKVPFKAEIIPTPAREKRVLWDQFHSIKYPPAYLPRDNLDVKNDILDWHGDHLHTNFHHMFDDLREHGYFVEVLGSPFTCFDAKLYGALLMVDSEEEFYPDEIEKLTKDVQEEGLGLVVFAEWYDEAMMKKMKFFDDNTRSWWTPVTGGANVPALNDLLGPFGIALGSGVLNGRIDMERSFRYSSGSKIIKFPAEGYLHEFELEARVSSGRTTRKKQPVLGLAPSKEGRIAVFGDANCLDASYQEIDCYDLLRGLLAYTAKSPDTTQMVSTLTDDSVRLDEDWAKEGADMPARPADIDYSEVSFVLQNEIQCYKNSERNVDAKKDAVTKLLGRDEARVQSDKPDEAVELIEEGNGVMNGDEEKVTGAKLKGDNLGEGGEAVVVEDARPITPNDSQTGTDPERLPTQVDRETAGQPPFWVAAPPINISKWSALVGVLVMVGLYRLTRRRRNGRDQSDHVV